MNLLWRINTVETSYWKSVMINVIAPSLDIVPLTTKIVRFITHSPDLLPQN